jgi:hypothetical protein
LLLLLLGDLLGHFGRWRDAPLIPARSRFFSLIMVTQNTRNNLIWVKFAIALCDRLNGRIGP